jgi:high-affinity Fe2+/Pb2+ permease
VAAVAVIVGVVLFAWLVPNRVAARSTGLTLAIISVPLLYAFWSALRADRHCAGRHVFVSIQVPALDPGRRP